jgi:hypothetical protein
MRRCTNSEDARRSRRQAADAAARALDAVPAALAQLLALAKSFGLELPKQDG